MSDSQDLMKPSKTIWVFRTSVSTQMDIRRLKPILDRIIKPDDQWNFDLEDCDHILRVVTWSLPALTIIDEVKNAGYRCEELEDLIPLPIQDIRSIDRDHMLAERVMCGY